MLFVSVRSPLSGPLRPPVTGPGQVIDPCARLPRSGDTDAFLGATAPLALPEYPGRSFTAKLVGSAEAFSVLSGTPLAQLQLDNPDHRIKPGAYALATFQVGAAGSVAGSAAGSAVQLPSSALKFRRGGAIVAVVWPDNRIHLQKVTIGRDLGPALELASGLNTSDG